MATVHRVTKSRTQLREKTITKGGGGGLVAKSYQTLCIPRGSSVHGISQAGILEWAAISSSRGSF